MFVPAVSCLVSVLPQFSTFILEVRRYLFTVTLACVALLAFLANFLSLAEFSFLPPSDHRRVCVCVFTLNVVLKMRRLQVVSCRDAQTIEVSHFFHLVGGNESSMAPACSSGMDQYCSPHRIVHQLHKFVQTFFHIFHTRTELVCMS